MLLEPLEPSKFVIELGAGRGIAIWKIKASDEHAAGLHLDIAAVENDQLRQDYNIDSDGASDREFYLNLAARRRGEKLFSTRSRKAINAFYESEEPGC